MKKFNIKKLSKSFQEKIYWFDRAKKWENFKRAWRYYYPNEDFKCGLNTKDIDGKLTMPTEQDCCDIGCCRDFEKYGCMYVQGFMDYPIVFDNWYEEYKKNRGD